MPFFFQDATVRFAYADVSITLQKARARKIQWFMCEAICFARKETEMTFEMFRTRSAHTRPPQPLLRPAL
ncbi:hypothetical protein SAMN05444748_11686 [Variovorax sp. OV700]|nr:hypothetical protein SAMN05444748_11686 [Variovorax sp. OV700]